MMKTRHLKSALFGSACAVCLVTAAAAENFNIPAGNLNAALNAYSKQAGVPVIVSADMVRGATTTGVVGNLSADEALSRILSGTGFTVYHDPAGALGIARGKQSATDITGNLSLQLAQAAPPPRAAVETVTVTSSKLGGADVQSIPIAITALSQEQLTSTQTAGGPDLVKQVPNLTFSKTNFTGYNIQIRGIGTQAISATTDPAVAVSLNDVPFLRNHLFEQEFFDVSQVEVLRGPQGTLYGRNATSGVVNIISAKPADQWEARASIDVGNYNNRRMEGMLNLPVLSDKVDLRVAGEWTKRDGYAFNEQTGSAIDGRDLWSSRISLLIHPIERLTATLIWEHFQEDDNRARSTKQLCKRDNAPAVVDGPAGPQVPNYVAVQGQFVGNFGTAWLSQGCAPVSLYSPDAFQTPNGGAIPFIAGIAILANGYLSNAHYIDPYAGLYQSPNLRVISSAIDPTYRAKNDTYELNADFSVTPALTLTSQTAYSKDFLYSTEDFNRFNTVPDFLQDRAPGSLDGVTFVGQDNEFCDPQLGCSSRFVAEDRSSGTTSQFYQELRLSSNFNGSFNFVGGANYLKYHVSDDYYVFSNLLTLLSMHSGNYQGYSIGGSTNTPASGVDAPHIPFNAANANACGPEPTNIDTINFAGFLNGIACQYIDPNPIDRVNGQGHNYFLSHNPYQLESWALFGETNYQITPDLKLIGGLRYTDDRKNFQVFPSVTLDAGQGLLQTGDIAQEWRELTGRAVVNWTPKLDFTDQTLVYASYAHGYKGGGANPPGVLPITYTFSGIAIDSPSNRTHPVTFEPEYNDAFELGSKNSLLDGVLTVNGDVFFYKYRNYQISYIVDRTAVNLNFDATVRGAELETAWEPFPGMKLGFSGGYENATVNDGQSAIDLMDRTNGNPDWMVVRPYVTQTSNCILPTYAINEMLRYGQPETPRGTGIFNLPVSCQQAYSYGDDPVTGKTYVADPSPIKIPNYPGFDPLAGNSPNDPYTGQNTYNGVDYGPAPNNGEGFAKDLSGNQLPNAPHFTTSLTADYTRPLSSDWVGTLHGDFYWHSDSFARVWNDRPYDELRGYTNVNLALIFTNQDGWQAMAYVKNVLDTTAITGAFLNSDDTALTTNVFTTDPRLFGIRITKNW
jgi:outer membrane receptor protein involved in Fe transport